MKVERRIDSENTADDNRYYGIYLRESNDNTIWENTASYNRFFYYSGIYIRSSNNNNVSSNIVTYNGWVGIEIDWWSDYNIISSNIANNSNYGIELAGNHNNVSGNSV